MSLLSIFSGSEYIVVQRDPVIVKGPYLDLQLAQDELKEMAKNDGSRMMVEFIDGVIQVDPQIINGILVILEIVIKLGKPSTTWRQATQS